MSTFLTVSHLKTVKTDMSHFGFDNYCVGEETFHVFWWRLVLLTRVGKIGFVDQGWKPVFGGNSLMWKLRAIMTYLHFHN